VKLNNLAHGDYESLIGKKLRIKRRDEVYTGTLLGLGDSRMATGPNTSVNPWRLDIDGGKQVDFLPEGREVYDESDSHFTDKA
jgi:hypothetical protein